MSQFNQREEQRSSSQHHHIVVIIRGNILPDISEISVSQLEEEVDHLNYDVINTRLLPLFWLVSSGPVGRWYTDGSWIIKVSFIRQPGGRGLIMMKRTKHMEAGGWEMGRESIISGYLSLLVALLSDCWAGHAPDVYKTIITCIFVTSQECLSALIQDNEKIKTCHLAFKMSGQINPIQCCPSPHDM